jgi:hypothetical protein
MSVLRCRLIAGFGCPPRLGASSVTTSRHTRSIAALSCVGAHRRLSPQRKDLFVTRLPELEIATRTANGNVQHRLPWCRRKPQLTASLILSLRRYQLDCIEGKASTQSVLRACSSRTESIRSTTHTFRGRLCAHSTNPPNTALIPPRGRVVPADELLRALPERHALCIQSCRSHEAFWILPTYPCCVE